MTACASYESTIYLNVLRAELDQDTGAARIPAIIWRFCTGTGRDFGFSRDFSKMNSVFLSPKFANL